MEKWNAYIHEARYTEGFVDRSRAEMHRSDSQHLLAVMTCAGVTVMAMFLDVLGSEAPRFSFDPGVSSLSP